MSAVIFTTPHGSRLYGLAHEGSDYDTFTVTDGSARMRQHTDGTTDVTSVGIYTLLRYAMGGSHQSAEAIFSRQKEWNPDLRAQWEPMIEGIRLGGPEVLRKYRRTVVKFAFGDFKRRRHACRLMWNAVSMETTFRFDPTMTAQAVVHANELAEKYEGESLIERLGARND